MSQFVFWSIFRFRIEFFIKIQIGRWVISFLDSFLIVAKDVKISTGQFPPPKKLAPKTGDSRHFQIRDKTA